MANETESTLDVKPVTESSSVTDVKETATDSSSKATTQTDAKPKSMADAVDQMLVEKHGIKPVSSTEDAPDGKIQDLNPTKKDEEKVEVKEDDKIEEKSEEKVEDKGPVPYERFSEVVNKHKELETNFKEVEPYVQAQKGLETYCAQHGITNDDFRSGMEIIALLKADPEAALAKLKPIYEGLQTLKGEVLPADLQQEVTDGVIPLERAKEIAQLRAQTKFGSERAKLTAQQQQQQAQQNLISSMQQGLNTWQQSKASDPDYKQKKDLNSPDGMYELVNDKWLNLMSLKQPKTAQEAVALAEQAYQAVKKSFAAMLPKPPPRKSLSSNGSSTTATQPPKDMHGAVSQMLKEKHGFTI